MIRKIIACILFWLSFSALADGVVVDRVYSPYVLPHETEVEWRLMSRNSDEKGNQLGQRIGYGHSLSEYVTVEFYLLGEREIGTDDFGLSGYELEARWMLTDQGQYWADWGLLFEIEKDHTKDNWEVSSGILFEKEFGKTSLTVNMFLIAEWGNTIESEWESEARVKLRYRFLPALQPAIELYAGQDFFGVGPALQGIKRFDGQKQLKWEVGFISDLSHRGKDHTLRFDIEYEF